MVRTDRQPNLVDKAIGEVPVGYGGKLPRRVAFTLDQGDMRFYRGGELSGRKVLGRHVLSSLPAYPGFDSPVQQAEFNRTFPQVVDALYPQADKGLQSEMYCGEVGGYDFNNILPVAHKIASQDADDGKRPVMRIVFGATPEMSARALGYILPGLVYAEHMSKAVDALKKPSLQPQLQIIFAHNISSAFNNVDPEVAHEQTRQFATMAKKIVERGFGHIEDLVLFLEDTGIEEGSPYRQELGRIAQELNRHAPEELKEQYRAKAEIRGADGRSPFYGAAHRLVHDVNLPGLFQPYFEGQAEMADPSVIISIGSKQERVFYDGRFVVKDILDEPDATPTLQFFTRHDAAPYLMSTISPEVSLKDAASNGKLPKGMEKKLQDDVDYIAHVLNRRNVSIERILREQAA